MLSYFPIAVLTACALAAPALAVTAADRPLMPTYETSDRPAPEGPIDELVWARLKKLGIQPANRSSDAVFLRRVYLDAIGTLPTAPEATAFLQDKDPDKRRVLIDKLLERDEFADYWAMKWSDLLRVKAEFPINLWPNAAQAYHHWIRASIRENKPYDRFVRELLTETGSNFRSAPVNFYRAMQSREPQAIAQTVALTFMGCRAEKWPKARLAAMGGFFGQIGFKETGEWKEEIVYFDASKPALPAAFPDGTAARLDGSRDPREVFADWLTAPRNPWLARAAVNRVWAWLVGRGIVQEPDDFRPDNLPRNPELLAYLERELAGSQYDLKKIYRLILNSNTYQLSSIPRTGRPGADAEFAYYPLRRLDAEVLIDALCQITGTTESYTSAIPEPYTVIPEGERSVRLPDGSITSSFLELFGRPSRDTGLEAERNNRMSAAQRLHLLNSSHVQRKIEQGPQFQALLRGAKNRQDAVGSLYLAILSRYPTAEEIKLVNGYGRPGKPKPQREAMVDLAWALMNSSEFLYRH
jgi:hypothetical protein